MIFCYCQSGKINIEMLKSNSVILILPLVQSCSNSLWSLYLVKSVFRLAHEVVISHICSVVFFVYISNHERIKHICIKTQQQKNTISSLMKCLQVLKLLAPVQELPLLRITSIEWLQRQYHKITYKPYQQYKTHLITLWDTLLLIKNQQ